MSLSRKKWFRLMAHTYRSVGYGVHYSTAVIFVLKHSVALYFLSSTTRRFHSELQKYFYISQVVAFRIELQIDSCIVLTLVIVQLFFSSFQEK